MFINGGRKVQNEDTRYEIKNNRRYIFYYCGESKG